MASKRRDAVAGFSTREVAEVLELKPRQIYSFVHAGFLHPRRGPGNAFRFSFQDVVVLRAAKGLLRARIPERRVRRVLEGLSRELPRGRPLSTVRVSASGSEVVVHDGTEAWNPESGQRVMDFEVADLAAKAAPLALASAQRAHEQAEELEADDWYELGFELEATNPDEAATAYRRALELASDHPDALLNLGRLRHEAGDLAEAETLYRRVAKLRPEDATPRYNLGVVLQDRGRAEEAIELYGQTIALDPDYADAYFNLAAVYEALGRKAVAIQNLKVYRKLVRGRA